MGFPLVSENRLLLVGKSPPRLELGRRPPFIHLPYNPATQWFLSLFRFQALVKRGRKPGPLSPGSVPSVETLLQVIPPGSLVSPGFNPDCEGAAPPKGLLGSHRRLLCRDSDPKTSLQGRRRRKTPTRGGLGRRARPTPYSTSALKQFLFVFGPNHPLSATCKFTPCH